MNARARPGTWVQCTHCGKIHHINIAVPIDELYVDYDCPRCGEYTKGLNCGSDKEDIVIYADPFLDERYYKY